jgi:hypothetical protein
MVIKEPFTSVHLDVHDVDGLPPDRIKGSRGCAGPTPYR